MEYMQGGFAVHLRNEKEAGVGKGGIRRMELPANDLHKA
jgi:hypothetical protein